MNKLSARGLYNLVFDGTETWVANRISDTETLMERRKYKSEIVVPKSYAKEYKAYWKPYGSFSPEWGWAYASRNGIEDVRYVPATLCYSRIDQFYNNRKLGWGFNDKNYYSRIFSSIKQPETIVHNIGGVLTDSNYKCVSVSEAFRKILSAGDDVICKPTLETGSGRNIQFWNTEKDAYLIQRFLDSPMNTDYIVQKVIKQNRTIASIHPQSVNTIRICSLLLDNEVNILSSCFRVGIGNSRVDNHHAGGVSVGITQEGLLKERAYYLTGEHLTRHPNGTIFKDFNLPGYNNAVELVKSAHPIIGHFKLASWDIAIDENEDAVLIECNMRKGGIELHQFSNGPLFGELTDRVLHDVFRRK